MEMGLWLAAEKLFSYCSARHGGQRAVRKYVGNLL